MKCVCVCVVHLMFRCQVSKFKRSKHALYFIVFHVFHKSAWVKSLLLIQLSLYLWSERGQTTSHALNHLCSLREDFALKALHVYQPLGPAGLVWVPPLFCTHYFKTASTWPNHHHRAASRHDSRVFCLFSESGFCLVCGVRLILALRRVVIGECAGRACGLSGLMIMVGHQ